MSVWLTIPSARPAAEAQPLFDLWAERGYKVAVWRDHVADRITADLIIETQYPGYGWAVNSLIGNVISLDAEARWFVIGGDDVEPDPTKRAEEIAEECEHRFLTVTRDIGPFEGWTREQVATFGVMQPVGDRWGDGRGAYIDRVAGSAWIGREFAARSYQGAGPLYHEYQHMFVDEELWHVARRLDVYWERTDLVHHHRHWGRKPTGGNTADMPPHLKRWNTAEHWRESRELFQARQAAGFPGHEPK